MSSRDLDAFVDCARRQALAVDGDSDDGGLPTLASIVGGARVVAWEKASTTVGEFNGFVRACFATSSIITVSRPLSSSAASSRRSAPTTTCWDCTTIATVPIWA